MNKLPLWKQTPEVIEFVFSITPYFVFLKSRGIVVDEVHYERATKSIDVVVAISHEAMPELPSDKILFRLIEDTVMRFQMELVEATKEQRK